jgi:hypothetical protein
MPQPTISDVHIDRPLSILTVGYKQDMANFIAGQVFPAVPVQNKSDLFWKYNRGDFFRNTMQLRADGTPAAGGGYKLATGRYTADVWALKKIVGDQVAANSDVPLNPERDATWWLTQQALVNREVNFMSTYFQPAVWQTTMTGQAAADATHVKFWDASGSDPITDVFNGKVAVLKATGLEPNTLSLGYLVYLRLLRNAAIIDLIKYGQTAPGPAIVTTEALCKLFGVERVLVSKAIQTTSNESLIADSDDVSNPDTTDFIGGNSALLSYSAGSPGLMQPSAGYTYEWTGYTGAIAGGFKIKKFRWEIDAAFHIELEQAYGYGLTSRYLGYFFSNVLSA